MSDKCLDLSVIQYEFNILARVVAITLFFINYIIISYKKGVQALFWEFYFGRAAEHILTSQMPFTFTFLII